MLFRSLACEVAYMMRKMLGHSEEKQKRMEEWEREEWEAGAADRAEARYFGY